MTAAAIDPITLSHDRPHVSPDDIATGVVIGRTSEFFDFFVYAIASVLVFPKVFFPYLTPLDGTLASFAVFTLAFVARPFGSIAFKWLDREHGRGVKLTVALFMLGGATAGIAFLPGYADIGRQAIWLLALLRLAQGFALGGAWDGLASLLALNAPENRRGWYAMIPQLGAPLGLIVASLMFAYFTSTLSADDFIDWGWRFPFFVALAINVVALFARLRIVVTAEFETLFASRDLQPARVRETWASQWKPILIGAFAPLASFAMFHMVTVFPLSWVNLYAAGTSTRFLLIETLSATIGTGAIIASGVMADRVGRRTTLGVSAVLIAVFSGFAVVLLGHDFGGELAYMVIGFVVLGLAFGQASGAVASNFPTRYRYTASAMTSDLAWLVGAGFAPFIALWLSANFGLMTGGTYLLSGAVLTLVALWYNRELGLTN